MRGKAKPPLKKHPEPPRLPGAPRRFGARLTRVQRRNRWLVGAATVGAHVAVFTALFWHYATPPRPKEPPALEVSLLDTPKPTPPVPPLPEEIDTGATVIVPDPKPPTIHITAQSTIQVTTPDDMSDRHRPQECATTLIVPARSARYWYRTLKEVVSWSLVR